MRPILRALFPLLVSVPAMTPVGAAEMPFGNNKVVYAAIEPKELRSFLREFAAQHGVGVFIDPEVKGELTGRYELTARSMMELLSRTFGLIWYFDGRVLYVYPATAVESAVVRLPDGSPAQFQRTLDRLGISDSRFPISFDADNGNALVSGPRRFVELVRQAAASSNRAPEIGDPGTSVRVYPLKFAFAQDYTITSGGREFRIPGVVSILRQVYAGEGQAGAPTEVRRLGPAQRRPLQAAGERAEPAQPVLPQLGSRRESAPAVDAEPAEETRRVVLTARGVPSFAADPRTNSVIVRDLPSRIDQYDAIVRRLDERPRLVELDTNIVEVNAENFDELGIDWRAAGRRGQGEVGGGGIGNAVTRPGGLPPTQSGDPIRDLGQIAGTVLGVVTGGRTQLFARLTALEQAGKARISAQPRVMTLNNVEAALDATNTFFVRVQGFQDAQLFDISAGTSIRITPSVVNAVPTAAAADGERDLVRLLIKIEDGGLTGQQVDQLPVVQRTTINTQSLIAEGSTLLIAGYAQERESSERTGVPLLSRIPVLGHAFKSSSSNRTRVERLFLITPRVVDLQTAEVAQPLNMLPRPGDPALPRPPTAPASAPAAPARDAASPAVTGQASPTASSAASAPDVTPEQARRALGFSATSMPPSRVYSPPAAPPATPPAAPLPARGPAAATVDAAAAALALPPRAPR